MTAAVEPLDSHIATFEHVLHCQIIMATWSGTTRVYPSFRTESITKQNNNNKHSLRSSTKGYGGKTH
jgi:hypothetical protein